MAEAFFLEAEPGQRFCIFHRSRLDPARGAIVYLHPFGEEMNKSRRMAALQARALAESGYDVLQIDLLGCGDSSGDFGDATWAAWIDDALLACAWVRARSAAPLWVWGLRAGALLAAAAANRLAGPVRLLLWNPVLSGRQFLQQFLRLRVAGEMLAGDGKGVMDDIRQRLAGGNAVEVAGYRLGPGLADGLGGAELALTREIEQIVWLDVSTQPEPTLSPAARMRLEKIQTYCKRVVSGVVPGPAFWQTTEIEEAPALLAASIAAMAERS